MKKIITLVVIAVAVVAASTLNIKVEIKTNSAYACANDNAC